MKRILIVDDDQELRSHLNKILRGAGYATEDAPSSNEALAKAAAEQFDLILLDMIMPKGNGLDALRELRRIAPQSKIIMITAFATVEKAVDAMKRGACEFISKPFKIEELLSTIRRVFEEARVEESDGNKDIDGILSALSNPTRTKILRLISARKSMRLKDLAQELSFENHTKALFHLKILKEAGVIDQDADKLYVLTHDGEKTITCLRVLDRHLADHHTR